MSGQAQFFANLDALAAEGITVDRPRGSAHPRYPDAIYPVDYGFLPNTTSGGGDGIDVFRGSGGNGVVAVFLTADVVKRDAEIKLVMDCSDEEVAAVAHFLNVTLGIGGLLVPRLVPPVQASGQRSVSCWGQRGGAGACES